MSLIDFAAGQAGTYYFVQNCRMVFRFVRRVTILSLIVATCIVEVVHFAKGH